MLADLRRGDPRFGQPAHPQQIGQVPGVLRVFSELRIAVLKVRMSLQVREAARTLKARLGWP
jgi:hypothetical protein